MRIEGSAALVAGGASGLGEATVRRLHERGATVTIADVNEERGQALAQELGQDAGFVKADVTSEDEVSAAVDAAVASAEDGLRISVSCAGVGWAEKVAGKRGPHQLVPNEPLDDGERGVCLNTASIAAFDGQIGQIAYSASKGGVVGMTLPAARDLAAGGIRVATIAPGLFDTPLLAALPQEQRDALGAQVPFPARLGLAGEYAALAEHLVENRMINGEVIRLDGALRMPPR